MKGNRRPIGIIFVCLACILQSESRHHRRFLLLAEYPACAALQTGVKPAAQLL